MNCDKCEHPATWLVYASFEDQSTSYGRLLTRYPAPMIRTCDSHLASQIRDDFNLDGSTAQWVVKPASVLEGYFPSCTW